MECKAMECKLPFVRLIAVERGLSAAYEEVVGAHEAPEVIIIIRM